MSSDESGDGTEDLHESVDDGGNAGERRDAAGRSNVPERNSDGSPLVAGGIGLLAGVAGGVAATTLAPGGPLVTALLAIAVTLVVTAGTLQILRR